MEYQKGFGLLHVSYILLSDTVDRLDMILLELRHLQRNIIHSMHEPAFNAPLRFEEDFLWGGKEKDSLDCKDTYWQLKEVEDYKKLEENIILFPIPSQEHKHDSDDDDLAPARAWMRKEIENYLQKRINDLWKEEWRMRHKRSYDHLRGTQILKRIIVQDKIDFCRFAIKEAGILPGEHAVDAIRPDALARFIIMRNAIHQRCSQQYLIRIMEYQSLFNKVLDIGVKDFPVPSLERRREIGIYMDFLNKRVRSSIKEMESLLEDKKFFGKTKDNFIEENIILHNWKHNFTAEHYFQKKYASGREEKDNCELHHIISNYYMPERADLQPMLAHEVAHLVVHHHFDNLTDNFLQNQEGAFADLLRSILRVLRRSDDAMHLENLSPAHKPRFLLREICCDLLAASIKGFSYLYAVLLEIVGADMYKHLLSSDIEFTDDPANSIDLEMIKYLAGSGGHLNTRRRDWWLRLKVIICWLKQTHHWKPSGLDHILVHGTEMLLDNLLVYLDEITLAPEEKTGVVWFALAERLCEEIEDSEAAITVLEWRMARSKAVDDTGKIKPEFPRSVAKINEQVREVLKAIQIGMKLSKGKGLFGKQENLDTLFNETYLIDSAYEYKKNECRGKAPNNNNAPDTYYIRHLHEISWKCSITRSIDLFGNDKKGNTWLDYYRDDPDKKMIYVLHHDNAIGRELHSIALDFYMFESENPVDKLVHSLHLLKNCKEICKLVLWKHDAKKIIEPKSEKNKERRDEREQENASETHLFKFFEEYDKLSQEIKAELMPLYNYIFAYKNKEKVIKGILDRITCLNEGECQKKNTENNKDAVRCFKMLLVGMHTAGGFYMMQHEQHEQAFASKQYSPVKLLDGHSYWFWSEEKKECPVYPYDDFKYSNVSGRYDAMSFVRVRQMRRCSFPHFETKNEFLDDEYTFPSLLTRREFGIKVDFRSEHDCSPHITDNGSKSKYCLAGYISVILKRRSLRLPFLARLLSSVKDSGPLLQEKMLAKYITSADTALLLDGSADFLLVLRTENSTDEDKKKKSLLKRTGELIDLAYELHQDFMVDRTEFILSASVLDIVAEDIADEKNDSEFSLECEIRCFEDRFLGRERSIDAFRERIEKNIKASERDSSSIKDSVEMLVTLEVTAGRKDFLLRFFNAKTCLPNTMNWFFDRQGGFRKALVALLETNAGSTDKQKQPNLFVDRIEVNVNKQPPRITNPQK